MSSAPSHWSRDLYAAALITVLSIPQGIAYAMIAGMPPAAGLYAAALPTVVGSLLRSSRHVITGPTNALSLLVGAMIAQHASLDPIAAGGLLAILVGAMQAGAGLLRLGVLVDYISTSVVTGYITGAGVLIAAGQLGNLTGTPMGDSPLPWQIMGWVHGLGAVELAPLGLGIGSAAAILALRRLRPRWPSEILVIGLATAAVPLLGLHTQTLADLGTIPGGLPAFGLPLEALPHLAILLPVAVAASLLSLVESSSVARSISAHTGQPLDLDREFLGQGAANIVAGMTSAYPTSGSLTRSALNHSVGGTTRWAGAIAGVAMLAVPTVAGPWLDRIPLAALAGLLMVVATNLVDLTRIRRVLLSNRGDAMAFGATLMGTWVLPLDRAIVLGVGISLVLFLRRARTLVISELRIDPDGRLVESMDGSGEGYPGIRVLHVEGQLFFAAARELEAALNAVIADPTVGVLILRLKRTQGLDLTTAEVLIAASERLQETGRHLFLVGMRPDTMNALQTSGAADHLGKDHLFPTQRRWFAATEDAIAAARALQHISDGPE